MSRLTDVARHVGLSEATVSRVLNERPGVSDGNRRAVLAAIDVLGYERPVKLRGDHRRFVGLFVSDVTDPFFGALADHVGRELATAGMSMILCPVQPGIATSEARELEVLLAHRVAGCIFGGGRYNELDADHGHYDLLVERMIPTVMINAVAPDLPFPRVQCDDNVAASLAWSHLAGLGHTEVGFVLGAAEHLPSLNRLQRWASFTRGSRASAAPERVRHTDYTTENAIAAAEELVESGVTAIICASDALALGAIRGARRAGRQVPADISVIGYNDSAVMAHVDPPLTTIRQPVDRMARASVAALIRQVGGAPPATLASRFEPELIVRGSTATAP